MTIEAQPANQDGDLRREQRAGGSQLTILHLCADIGSDSRYYDLDSKYKVLRIGKDIGVEKYTPSIDVHGIIANPVCTDFSIANYNRERDEDRGMLLVNHCLRIIEMANPKWWVMENPATGTLRKRIGNPAATYQPWQFGSPWTKKTGLWGSFAMPKALYGCWDACPKLPIYTRPSRTKPSLAYLHKSSKYLIPEMQWAMDKINTDADIRSWCSQGFARSFYEANP